MYRPVSVASVAHLNKWTWLIKMKPPRQITLLSQSNCFFALIMKLFKMFWHPERFCTSAMIETSEHHQHMQAAGGCHGVKYCRRGENQEPDKTWWFEWRICRRAAQLSRCRGCRRPAWRRQSEVNAKIAGNGENSRRDKNWRQIDFQPAAARRSGVL